MNVVNVQVVRPNKKWPEVVGAIVGRITVWLINSWILMLILGAISPWHLSYIHAALAVIAARCLFPSSSTDHFYWTKREKS